MSEEELREQWRQDELALGAIGHRFEKVLLPTVTVRLPRDLAERAAEAWDREDGGASSVLRTPPPGCGGTGPAPSPSSARPCASGAAATGMRSWSSWASS
jgi:hypothetical protein